MNNCFEHADLMTILRETSLAVIRLDGCSNSVAMNQAAAEMFHTLGHELREVLGKSIWDLFPGLKGTVVGQSLSAVLQYNVPAHYEFFSTADEHWYETRAYPLPPGVILTFRDITQCKSILCR